MNGRAIYRSEGRIAAFISILTLFAVIGPPIGGAVFLFSILVMDGLEAVQAVGGLNGRFLLVAYAIGIAPMLATGLPVALRRLSVPAVRLRFALLVAVWAPAILVAALFAISATLGPATVDPDPDRLRRDFEDAMTLIAGTTPPTVIATCGCWWAARRRGFL